MVRVAMRTPNPHRGNMNLGARIKQARDAAGLTQEALADRVGVGSAMVSRWEGGLRLPPVDRLVLIARVTQTTVDHLTETMEVDVVQDTPERRIAELEAELARTQEQLASVEAAKRRRTAS